MNAPLSGQLGDYRILEPIGAGGMGEVYLAENVHSRKRYALKVLPRALAGDPNFVYRFFDEARLMSDLRHAHIVQVHHMGRHEGVYFLVMDYVTGPDGKPESLHDRLKDRRHAPDGRLPEADVRRWALQVAEALAYAHERGVVHRDLKPANILLDANGNAVLTDFGLAKAIGSEFILSQVHETTLRSLGSMPTSPLVDSQVDARTRFNEKGKPSGHRSSSASSIMGTYDYMAPEQRGEFGGRIDGRTDLYALGLALYRMLVGRRPGGLARAPSAVVRSIPRRWDRILRKCMAYDPDGRYGSAAELLKDLRGFGRHRLLSPRLGIVSFVLALVAVGVAFGPVAARYAELTYWRWRASAACGLIERVGAESDSAILTPADGPPRADLEAATRMYKQGDSAAAVKQLKRLVVRGKAAEAELRKRRDADMAISQISLARDEAARVRADRCAPTEWTNAEALRKKAYQAHEDRDYANVHALAPQTVAAYEQAADVTTYLREEATTAQAEFENAAEAQQELLRRYAADGWNQIALDVEAAQKALNSDDLAAATLRYRAARAQLEKLVVPARARKAATAEERAVDSRRQARDAEAARLAPLEWGAAEAERDVADKHAREGRQDDAAERWDTAATKYDAAASAARSRRDAFMKLIERYTGIVNNSDLLQQHGNSAWKDLQSREAAAQAQFSEGDPAAAEQAYALIIKDAGDVVMAARARQAEASCKAARETAERVFANTLATDHWDTANAHEENASQAFTRGDYAEALRLRDAARIAYERATRRATESAAPVQQAKSRYDAALELEQEKTGQRPADLTAAKQLAQNADDAYRRGEIDAAVKQYGDAVRAIAVAGRRADATVLRQQFEKLESDNSDVLKRHGGARAQLAGQRAAQARQAWDAASVDDDLETWHQSVSHWEASLADLRAAVDAARRVAETLDKLRDAARAGGITLGTPPGFVSARQISAANELLRQIESVAAEVTADPALQQLRTELAAWTKPVPWQLAPGMTPDAVAAAQRAAAARFGVSETRELTVGVEKIQLRLIPPGECAAGIVERPFYMSATEITQAQWSAVMSSNPSLHRGERLPVDSVSWAQAKAFCEAASRISASRVRLPTKLEWEYACLAGDRGPFGFGANNIVSGTFREFKGATLDRYGWYAANSGANPESAAVGQKLPNALGLHDMHGNVEEWCLDVFPGGFQQQRVVCGGAFKLKASDCACASSRGQIESRSDPLVGMRIIVEVP